jgi:hypothetical protein
MAFTWTIAKKSVHGDERVIHGLVTADGTAGSVATGLSVINGVSWSPKLLASATCACFGINVGPTSTATAGTLAVTGVTSGDTMYVTVFGV